MVGQGELKSHSASPHSHMVLQCGVCDAEQGSRGQAVDGAGAGFGSWPVTAGAPVTRRDPCDAHHAAEAAWREREGLHRVSRCASLKITVVERVGRLGAEGLRKDLMGAAMQDAALHSAIAPDSANAWPAPRRRHSARSAPSPCRFSAYSCHQCCYRCCRHRSGMMLNCAGTLDMYAVLWQGQQARQSMRNASVCPGCARKRSYTARIDTKWLNQLHSRANQWQPR